MTTPDERFQRAVNAPYDHEPIEADREALRFVRSWHLYPELREVLTYHGVNLGEMMETHLLRDVAPAMTDQFDAPEPR